MKGKFQVRKERVTDSVSIDLNGISKMYGEHRALHPTDLHVDEGELVTLLGPSGCGKTTLLRIIAGFVKPSSGEVFVNGRDITNVPESQREVGLLFQSYALFPHMSVAQNVAFGLKMRKMSRPQISEKVDQLLELVSMREFADRYPRRLSGGQQQRVALARVLAIEPKVLLLDEPLAALDRQLRTQMQVELANLVARVGITTVFVTHDQEEALTMSDRIAVMDNGRVAQYGTPAEIYDFPQTEFVANFVGHSNLIGGRFIAGATPIFEFSGHRFPLRPVETATRKLETGPRTLLVRPEHLEVLPFDAQVGVPGTVRRRQGIGDAVIYEVAVDDGPVLRAKVGRERGHELLAEDTPVRLSISETAPGWLLPEETVMSA